MMEKLCLLVPPSSPHLVRLHHAALCVFLSFYIILVRLLHFIMNLDIQLSLVLGILAAEERASDDRSYERSSVDSHVPSGMKQ
jgi:hypothetical protein